MSKTTEEVYLMGKVYKAILKAMGARENGTPKTSCVEDAQHVKQILMLLSLAFTAGALSFGYKGLPGRTQVIEHKLIVVEQQLLVLQAMDARLERIEGLLMGAQVHNARRH